MSVVLDYGLDSPARALLVLVLSVKDREQKKEMRKLQIHKTIKYFEYLREEENIDFSNFKYGGVSYELHENLLTLEECDLVEKVHGKYVLTEEGERAAQELMENLDREELRKLAFAKHQLNDLSRNELLYFMYRLLPETQKFSTEFEGLDRKKEILVPRLFMKGRINSTTAAKWLGVDEKAFLDSLSHSEQK